MEITVKRKWFTAESTISELYVGTQLVCYCLEDVDRGLTQTMSLSEIQDKKIYGKTAIPVGRYELAINYSNKFGRLLPLLLNVPGFEGIRIHSGNTQADSLGCLLPGLRRANNRVVDSRIAFNDLLLRINTALKTEKVFVSIRRD